MKILLLGKDGQLGRELQTALAAGLAAPHSLTPHSLIVCGRAHADLADAAALRALVARHAPDVLVNAAAYTAVERAESEPELAMQVNAVAPAVLAEEMARRGGTLVHYSTDYVFDGSKSGAWTEADRPVPLNQYGRSKLAGERAIADSGCRHLIFRTSWVYGRHGANFVKTMLRLARERDTLRVVADQFGAPTSATLIADITARAVQALHGTPGPAAQRGGLFHLAAGGVTNWHAYAAFLIESATALGMALRVTADRVQPIASSDYPVAARRPANSRLATGKLCAAFGVTMPDWRDGVRDMLEQLHSAGET